MNWRDYEDRSRLLALLMDMREHIEVNTFQIGKNRVYTTEEKMLLSRIREEEKLWKMIVRKHCTESS